VLGDEAENIKSAFQNSVLMRKRDAGRSASKSAGE
jgi:hypothetical protein